MGWPLYSVAVLFAGMTWGKPAVVGPLKNLAGNHSQSIVVANGPGTMIQLRQKTNLHGRIVSTGFEA